MILPVNITERVFKKKKKKTKTKNNKNNYTYLLKK